MPSLIGNKPNQVPSNGDLGTLAFQDANAVNIQGGSVSNITDLAITDGGTGASTAANARVNLGVDNYGMLKNRIINGAMVIDQRNAGASVTIGAVANTYTLDRWFAYGDQASKFSVQQNAGAVTPPVGFSNYLGVTSLSAYTVGAGEFFNITQRIEGFNTADLDFGKANAKTITLSFWVRSSLTGTFGGALSNSANSRGYPFTYTINSANTWEYETITITGDTTGTWVGSTNGIGLSVILNLGAGATYSGTAGSWQAAYLRSATGATSVVGTNGATFYITGVQLEVGTQATSFEYRQYGTELSLCQRYFETSYDYGQALGATPTNISYTRWSTNGTANALEKWFRVSKRATPTVNTYDTAGNAGKIRIFDGITDANNVTPTGIFGTFNSMWITYNATANGMQFLYTASAEL
jgi:hypothetical protein